MMNWGYSMMEGWFFMMLFPVILIGIILFAVIQTSRNRYRSASSGQNDTSFDILKERLAKGEISVEEYNSKKEILKNKDL
ncbi:MAG: SHOCT domain-containing protein [Clostridiaceae bacterium]